MLERFCLLVIVLAVSPALLRAAGPVALETFDELAWTGKPAAKQVQYQPPGAPPRPGVVFRRIPGRTTTWTRPLKADLSDVRTIAVRALSHGPVRATLALTSGEGAYTRTFELGPGEQIVLLPTVTFTPGEKVGGWDAVRSISLTLDGPQVARRDLLVTLLGIQALDQDEPVACEGEVLLYHPDNRVQPTAVAWPLYAIVDTAKRRRGGAFGRIFAQHLERLTGVKLPVNPEGVEPGPGLYNVFLLGREAALAADGPRVALCGQTVHGAGYGIYRFLEKQGCRFYGLGAPSVIPHKNAPLLTPCEISDKPALDIKGGPGGYSARGWTGAIGDPKKIVPEGLLDTFWLDHTAAYLVPKRLYHDEHPEYYSLLSGGKRLPKTTPDVRMMLCLSNPDVLRISTERALKWIDAQPDRYVYCITQADGPDWCTCENCAKLGNRADQTLHWVNHVARAVAKKYPDKWLMTFAYNGAEEPPTRLKPEPNVVVCYAAWPSATCAPNSLGNYDHPANEPAYTHLKGWLKIAPGQMGVYDYNGGGRMTLYSMAERIKFMGKHNMRAVWYCGTNKMWPNLYNFVHGRLTWDPYEDVGRLKNEFIRAFYGDAAPTVLRLFDLMYDRLMLGGYEGVYPPPEYFGHAFVRRTYELFDKALAETKGMGRPHENLVQTRNLFIGNALRLCPGFDGELTDDQYAAFGRNLREYVEKVWLPGYQEKLAAHQADATKKAPSFKGLHDRVWKLCYVDIGRSPGGLELPPRLAELIEHPKETVAKHRQNDFVTQTDAGWLLPGIQFRGARNLGAYSWFCPRRQDTVAVYGALTDMSRCTARLELDAPPAGPAVLKIEGQDSEKAWAPPARIQIWVNDRKVFDGRNEFPKRGWAWRQYAIPAGTLRKGANTVEVRNLAGTDSLAAMWVMFSEVRIEPERP